MSEITLRAVIYS